MVKQEEGVTDMKSMSSLLEKGNVAGVVVQQPNRYGIIEDYDGLADKCHEHKALMIMNSVAADLALLKTPGELGADIAVGEAPGLLGVPNVIRKVHISGIYAVQKSLCSKMPGRIDRRNT